MSAKLTEQQQRVAKVLENMRNLVLSSDDVAGDFVDGLEEMLNNLAFNDAFGTECQLDPRGDSRTGEWSMECVEGVDHQ